MPPVIAFLAVLIASPQGPSAGADERLAWFAVIPPDGWTFATASSDRTVRLWHTATGTERAIFQGHTRDVVSVSFGPTAEL